MTIFTYKNLCRAYINCRENNLKALLTELQSRNYKPGQSICFVVKYPQPREIFAANFRDRIVHHLLVREILNESDKSFFFNSFACRRRKGSHKAVETLKRYSRIASRDRKDKIFFLQLDIKNFFVSIKHDILFTIFSDFINGLDRLDEWKSEMSWLGSVIIFHEPQKDCEIRGDRKLFKQIPHHKSLFHTPSGSGLPIGNYSSQFFANMYLNELDYFIKQKLGLKYYVRYVDDFVLLDNDRSKLQILETIINDFLIGRLGIKLNLDKTKLKDTAQGIDFLGYFIKSGYTLVRRRVVHNCKDKIYLSPVLSTDLLIKKYTSQVNSYLGHFIHANSNRLRRKIILDSVAKFNGLFWYNKDYRSIKIIKKTSRQILPLPTLGW